TELARRGSLAIVVQHSDYAVGLLELGRGDPEAAVACLERVAELAERMGQEEPGVFQWGAELVEAYLAASRTARAEAAAAELDGRAAATARTWALAAAQRCRGLLAPEGGIDASFLEALRLHESTRAPFQRARTELAYGRRL